MIVDPSATLPPDSLAALSLERGRSRRQAVPRRGHAGWTPAPDRPDPVALLMRSNEGRLPDLAPIRIGRMLASPFAFLRGSAAVMAADLATTPQSGSIVQLCGDAHLANFGVFASPERRLVFDLNDFDETYRGPWEWDVKRLAASFDIAARNNGYTDAERRKIVLTCARGYRTAMTTFATMSNLQVWYAHLNIEEQLKRLAAKLDPTRFKALKKNLAKARARDSVQAFTKLTRKDGGEPRIVSDPPLIVPMEELLPEGKDLDQVTDELMGVIRSYRKTLETDRRHLLEEYRFVQIARKVVGVGSVGTRSWIILLLGRDGGDPLFLQAKEAGESVLEHFVGKSAFTNHGQRVVAGQRLSRRTRTSSWDGSA